MSNKRDYYEVLGVPKDADSSALKKSYRKLAMQFHPDRNPDNPEAAQKFKEAAEAYDVLSDQDKRSRYDRFGHEGLRGAGYLGFEGGFEDIFSAFGDMFGDLFGFGGPGGRAGHRRGGQPRPQASRALLGGQERWRPRLLLLRVGGAAAAQGCQPPAPVSGFASGSEHLCWGNASNCLNFCVRQVYDHTNS